MHFGNVTLQLWSPVKNDGHKHFPVIEKYRQIITFQNIIFCIRKSFQKCAVTSLWIVTLYRSKNHYYRVCQKNQGSQFRLLNNRGCIFTSIYSWNRRLIIWLQIYHITFCKLKTLFICEKIYFELIPHFRVYFFPVQSAYWFWFR